MKFKTVCFFIASLFLASCQPKPVEISLHETSTPMLPSIPSSVVTNTAEESHNTDNKNVLLDYAFSSDGKTLAIYSNTGIYFYDLPSMNKSVFLEFEDNKYSELRSGAIAFSPNNKQIAISGKFDDSPIAIWNVESKELATQIYNLPNGYFVTEIEFSPNGQSILVRNTYPTSLHCEGLEDKVSLYGLPKGNELFEIDKCVIYPPIQFRFTYDDRIFLYYGSMSPAYSVYFIDSNTGEIISREDLEWNNSEHFYDISPDGKAYLVEKIENEKRITYLLDSQSNEVLNAIEGKIISLYGENGFVVSSYSTNPQWSFWEDGKFKCNYDGVKQSPEIKMSANGEIFMVMKSYTDYQVWEVSTCQIAGELRFDK